MHYEQHVNKAKLQHDQYRDQCQSAKEVFKSLPENNQTRGQTECSTDATMHYSFDYAQQVHYPHFAQQVGPFKTPRKVQCFGICCEGSSSQIFYLIEEAESPGKGADSVTSMLHQNKNNTVIWYGMWRTLTSRHISVEYNLMEAGHTKFNPDWHFGLWKSRCRNSTAQNLTEVADTVRASSRNGDNVP